LQLNGFEVEIFHKGRFVGEFLREREWILMGRFRNGIEDDGRINDGRVNDRGIDDDRRVDDRGIDDDATAFEVDWNAFKEWSSIHDFQALS